MTGRDVWLAIVSVFVGPLMGSLTFVATASAIDAIAYAANAPASNLLIENWPMVLSAGYVFGTVPGLLFAIVMAILSCRLPTLRARFSAAAIVGAVTSIAILGFVLFGEFRSGVDWVLLASVAFTGVVAGVVNLALVEWFHPLPAKATT